MTDSLGVSVADAVGATPKETDAMTTPKYCAYTLEAIRAAYGGDPSLACWQTPEGIAGVIEELSGMARANIVKGYNAGVKAQQDADRQTENEDAARLAYMASDPEVLRYLAAPRAGRPDPDGGLSDAK
jgi:hypothetical protein